MKNFKTITLLAILLIFTLNSCNFFSKKNSKRTKVEAKEDKAKSSDVLNLTSPLRPNEKLVLDSVYTDTIMFADWIYGGEEFQYLKGYKNNKEVLITHLLDEAGQDEYQLELGDNITVQWKIHKYDEPAHDEIFYYKETLVFLEKNEGDNTNFLDTDFAKIVQEKRRIPNSFLDKKYIVKHITDYLAIDKSPILDAIYYFKPNVDEDSPLFYLLMNINRSTENLKKIISPDDLNFLYLWFKGNNYYKASGMQNIVSGLLLAHQEFEENPRKLEKLRYRLVTLDYANFREIEDIKTSKMEALLAANNYSIYNNESFLGSRLFYVYSFWVRRNKEGNSAYVYELLKDIHKHLAKDSFFSFTPEKAQGILVGDTINLLDDDLKLKEDISKYNGKLVSIESSSEGLYNQEESCDAYHLVKVKLKEKEGLVDGRKVYKIIEKNAKKIISNNSEKIIYRTEFYGIGAFDEEGLTFCSNYHEPVVLKDKKNNHFGFIEVVQDSLSKKWADPNFKYFELASNDGFSDYIQRTTKTDKGIVLTIGRQYQEGYGIYQVLLRYQNGIYTAEYYNFLNKQYKVEDMVIFAYEETEGDDYYAIPYFYFADFHYVDNETYLYPHELKEYKVETSKGVLRVYKGYSDAISIISIQDKDNEVLYYKIIRKDTRYKVEYGDLDALLAERNIAYKDLISPSNYVSTIDDWLENATLLNERSTMYTDLELKRTPNIKAIQQEVTTSLANKYENGTYPLAVLLETYKQKTQKKNPIIMENMLSYSGNKKYEHSGGIKTALKEKRVIIPIDSINICYINNKNELFKVNYLNNSVDYTFGDDKDYILLDDNYLKVINSENLLTEEGNKIKLFHKDMKKEDYLIMYQLKLKNTDTYIYSPIKKIFYDKIEN